MADLKISEATDGGAMVATDNVATERGGVSFRTQIPQNLRSSDSPTFVGATLSGLSDGLVKSSTGLLSGGNTVTLTSEVSGILPQANGGTSIDTSGAIDGQLLVGGTLSNDLQLAIITGTANQVTVTNGTNTITLSGPQDLATGSSPTFVAATLSGLADGLLKSSTGLLSGGNTVTLTSEVSGVLPQANGGTGIDTSSTTDGQLLVGGTSSNDLQLATLTGTSNQVTVTNGTNSITLSGPQDLATGSSPTFAAQTITGGLDVGGDIQGHLKVVNHTGISETLTNADRSALNTFTNASDIAAIVPQTSTETLAEGTFWIFNNIGSSDVTITKEGADVLDGNTLVGPGDFATVYKRIAGTPNTYTIKGGTSVSSIQETIFVQTVADVTYNVWLKLDFVGTIDAITSKSIGGNCTATSKLNTTAVTATANAVSSTRVSETVTGANVTAVGDDLVVTISANSACTDMTITYDFTIVG